ncbi:hypothetical protein C8Z91_02785 [Paenibacillus elgii]|uniref:Bacteriophage SP-beta YorD domain-containing protein n=1 Tax=Paenibacillus elgii TaxID=189691 RepID=A0A2T6G9F9_9BACL|nr:XkdW family protein [Paenibacillus elgii]PUA40771.1 hypothetical protein C8Z91_02785 [Paenibacillus elgii]
MNIKKAILHMYPEAKPDQDFIVFDDGEGPYIAKWDVRDAQHQIVPKPSKEQLEMAYQTAVNAEKSNSPAGSPDDPLSGVKQQNAMLLMTLALKEVELKDLKKQNAGILLTLAKNNIR